MSDLAKAQSKKEAFIADVLMPYYLERIESEDDRIKRVTLQKQIATMMIFPYLSKDGTRYGALKEPGIRWYFTENEDNNQVFSTESYRILNEKVFKEEKLLKRFKYVFGTDGCGYIEKFTNNAVIEDLISQMSKEKAFTSYWWRCAADAFALWNTEFDPGNTYEKATESIEISYMLFDDEYCEPEYQRLLEKYRIVWDIRSTYGFKGFMKSIPNSHIEDALRFLKYLGVPTEFVMERGRGKRLIDSKIKELFSRLNQLPYPVTKTAPYNYDFCRLSEYLYFQIFCESHIQFAEDLYKNPITAGGIYVRNVRDEYMPLKVSMFYLPDDHAKESLEEDLPDDLMNVFLILPKLYSTDRLKQVACSTNDIDCFESYRFGDINVKELPFYKWAWRFTHSEKLAGNILKLLTEMKNIDRTQEEFVLDVLEGICARNSLGILEVPTVVSGSSFVAAVSGDNALRYAELINAVYRSMNADVYFVVSSDVTQEPLGIEYRILEKIRKQYSVNDAKRIEHAEFWNNIWLLDAPSSGNTYYGKYVNVKVNNIWKGVKKDGILLCREGNANSYIEAVCAYIEDVYDIHLEGVTSDWKAEYYQLVHKVNDFLCECKEAISEEDILFNESVMSDVDSMEEEYHIWNRFNREKESILGNRVLDVDLDSWRSFLNSKYHGRCQLCGNRTVSGVQNAYYWTYRIVKEKADGGNELANLHSNIFCLCPSCHGELSRSYMGKNLRQIRNKALEYLEQLNEAMSEELEDLSETDSVISMFADTINEHKGFRSPIVCDVLVNGKERQMKFSWEHFMKIAFLLSGLDDKESDA